MKSIKAIFRRGQTSTKLDGQIHTPEDLSRSSSVTNLNAVEQNSPKKTGTTKPRKSSSRDRLDKIVSGTGTTERKNDRKGLTKNNNKFDTGDQSLTLDSLQEIESLKTQLHQMATEKSSLALKLGEQKGQIHSLQHQIENLKMYQEQSNLQLEQLTEENTALRNRLRDVAHSPLSDNEKQQLLYESHRHHNSAPASIATNPMEDGTCGDVTACPTPDWDKHSSSNVSEISVACLQDKINQMQETHYSTNEELQATLQELTDLQRQLTELQQENERLVEEKNLMFDSLCRQTERLKDTRHEVESLKTVLYREKNEPGIETAQEREEKLVDLLKSAQDEHESLISKHEQLSGELQELREANDALHEQLKVVTERNGTLESTLDAKQAEHKLLDQELTQARDQCSGNQIEINRLKDLLENARTKINELEQDRALSDKSELDELLDNARKEKDALESEVAHLKEQLARSKNEIEKLKEQVSILQEECKVIRNNARTIQSDLEYKYEKLASEKSALTEQLHKFQDIINELQVQAQCQEEDKRNLSDVLAETQRNLSESERKIAMLENELADVKKLRKEENEEWEKFQNDLLTSVRVANDFKTEAQQDLQKMIMENKEHRDKVRLLEAQLDKLKVTTEANVTMRPSSFPGGEELTRRTKIGLTRQNSRQSVKSLIESIENQGKPIAKNALNIVSRSSSNSSLNSLASDARTPSSPSVVLVAPSFSPASPLRNSSEWTEPTLVQIKTPLKEQQPNKLARDWSKTHITDSLLKNDISKVKTEENYRESILQKGMDFSRRNSYSDLSERKDPLNGLIKNGGSKRNALLKWCQNKTIGYQNIDITNFSSSWNDGLALCALLHTYLPDRIPYDSLNPHEKRRNFSLAFSAAESVGIPTTLNINDMVQLERPDWQQVMSYVTAIYKHFET
ncbi:cytospin-A-like isoform X4 [Coccinella septempunctata]|uniref:cytospin-A-like isoform X4 n=1 Tax=Coccinella septempunctata TaxID=41139 RepID=UPI001D07F2D6|nr:cytospin-A-like isoform X4 [Coccinella septempunctata]